MMGNFKLYITMMAAAFVVMGMPLTAQALTPSDNSASVFPAEGNGKCSDYAENGVIMSLTSNIIPGGTSTATDGTASADVTFSADATSLSFDSDTKRRPKHFFSFSFLLFRSRFSFQFFGRFIPKINRVPSFIFRSGL